MSIEEKVGFRNFMYVYSLEEASNPSELMVAIPDVFVDKKSSVSDSQKINKGDVSIFKNVNLPAFSKYYTSKNYMRIPVIKHFGGESNVVGPAIVPDGNRLKISSSLPTNYPLEVGIGKVNPGDRLLAVFINNNPTMGMIIARC